MIGVFRERQDTRYSVIIARAYGSVSDYHLASSRDQTQVLTENVDKEVRGLVNKLVYEVGLEKQAKHDLNALLLSILSVVGVGSLLILVWIVVESTWLADRRALERECDKLFLR